MDDTSSNALNTEENTSLIEFPCDFPIKVMGVYHDEFSVIILDVVQQNAPHTCAHHITIRPSSKGNYLGATVIVNVDNQEQLDNIYRSLTFHPRVKMVL